MKVFTDGQQAKILEAIDAYPQYNTYGHDSRARVRALVLTLRYSGMRVGDVVGLRTSDLKKDKIFLTCRRVAAKSTCRSRRSPSTVKAVATDDSPYFFWTGNGLRKSAVADWQRAIRRLFEIADVTGHPHMVVTRSRQTRSREASRPRRSRSGDPCNLATALLA